MPIPVPPLASILDGFHLSINARPAPLTPYLHCVHWSASPRSGSHVEGRFLSTRPLHHLSPTIRIPTRLNTSVRLAPDGFLPGRGRSSGCATTCHPTPLCPFEGECSPPVSVVSVRGPGLDVLQSRVRVAGAHCSPHCIRSSANARPRPPPARPCLSTSSTFPPNAMT